MAKKYHLHQKVQYKKSENQKIQIQFKNKLKETFKIIEKTSNKDNLQNEIENSVKLVATEVLRFEEEQEKII